jgi:aspartate carbamoyltransferase catalytic subunit
VLSGPATLIPREIEGMNVRVETDFDKAIEDADVVMMLRIQMERQKESFFPSLEEFNMLYGLSRERVKRLKKNGIVMHPGPINRGVEINSEVADGSRSVILEQVSNGISIRMAVLYLLAGGKINELTH